MQDNRNVPSPWSELSPMPPASAASVVPASVVPPPSWPSGSADFRPPAVAPKSSALLYELRPLSTGEILDRTFSIYRKRFWLFTGLSVVASSVTTLGEFVRLTFGVGQLAAMGSLGGATTQATTPEAAQRPGLITMGSLIVTILFYFIAYSLTQAATVSAVSDVYLGRETSIGKAFRVVRGHWGRYILISLWQGWSYVWLPMLLFTLALVGAAGIGAMKGGGVLMGLVVGALALAGVLSIFYGIYAYMRNSLAIVASVIEGLKVRKAMRRSKDLTKGRILRVLALLLLLFVLSIVASVAQGIPALLFSLFLKNAVLRVVMEILTLVATFITGAMLAPVGAIAFCLFYIDERVRREGYDVETLLERAGTVPVQMPLVDASPFSGELA
jgi:hypothetical protein